MKNDITPLCLPAAAPVRDAMARIDASGGGIVLVVDSEERLQGTIVDGDVRRGILAGLDADSPIQGLLDRKVGTNQEAPLVMPVDTPDGTLLQLMQERSVRHIPLLAADGRVTDLARLDQLLPDTRRDIQAVIMAGGAGSRMRPLTAKTAKPMLPVGGRPLLELTMEQLQQVGINNVSISTHYRADDIRSHFGDGERFDMNIDYVHEQEPLGTAGSLNLMKKPDGPVLVLNGDILTEMNFQTMFHYHRDHDADLTIALRKYEFKVPYGVVECEEHKVVGVKEKPAYAFFVNAGIYFLEPIVFEYLPSGRVDMTEVIEVLSAKGRSVIGFPVVEYWLDIGRPADYQQAQDDVERR